MSRSGRPPSSAGDVGAAFAGTVVAALPVFLVGALAVQIRTGLHFGAGALGTVLAVYYIGAGLSSVPLGRLVEALGALRSMRAAAAASGVLLALVAAAAHSRLSLALLMAPAGVGSALMQPAANQFLARRVALERQGLAFGLKQSAVPLAATIGGLAVPGIALTVGWRWAFVVAAGCALGVAGLLPRPTQSLRERTQARRAERRAPLSPAPLVALSVGFGLGVGAASAMAGFLVSSAVAGGMARGSAGLLAALGGTAAIVGRVVTGARADRRGARHVGAVAAMLATGGLGYLALALASAAHLTAVLVPAVLVTFAVGWGWNGLFNLAVVQAYPAHPGRATAITQAGGRGGSAAGPLLFGLVVAHGSYGWAWFVEAVLAVVAATVMLVAGRLIRRMRPVLPSVRAGDTTLDDVLEG